VTLKDRLDTLEASHISFIKEHEKRVAEQDERWRQFDAWREQEYKRQIQRDVETDRRIRDLVTAVGKLIETRTP
jgi:hypothetical protein